VTEHPTTDWTIQQFRAVITPETAHRFVLHDRDGIYAAEVDRAITSMRQRVLKTPVRTPQAKQATLGHIREQRADGPLSGICQPLEPPRSADSRRTLSAASRCFLSATC